MLGFGGGDLNFYRFVGNNPASMVDPAGLEGGYWEGVGEVFKGYGDAIADTATGLYTMARHPIQTAQGIGSAVMHPIQTGQAIIADVKEKSGSLRGQGSIGGDFLLSLAGGATANAFRKSAAVTKVTNKLKKLRAGGAAAESCPTPSIPQSPRPVNPGSGSRPTSPVPGPAGVRPVPRRGRPDPITGTPRPAPSFKPDPRNNVTAKPRTVSEFLGDAEAFLGKGYYEGRDGAFYSADGSRRVRFTPSDLAGHNGGPPHGHFEFNGGRNIHVPLTDK